MQTYPVFLVDEYGHPLSERLHDALAALIPRLKRMFPALRDDCAVIEILEEAGRRIAAIETRKGPIESLEAYAWTVTRRMAALRLRLDEWAIAGAALTSDQSRTAFDRLVSTFGTPEQMEARILCAELATHFTAAERDLIKARQGGLSLKEIGTLQGTSGAGASVAWRRLKRKVHSLLTPTARRTTAPAWKKIAEFEGDGLSRHPWREVKRSR